MYNFNIFVTLFFIALFYTGESNACQPLIVADFIEEIKAKEGDLTIREVEDGYYINPSLLVLQDDGIHLNDGYHDFLVPFIYHDTEGYFLSYDACDNWGNRWRCCLCNNENDMLRTTCRVCLQTRCRILK